LKPAPLSRASEPAWQHEERTYDEDVKNVCRQQHKEYKDPPVNSRSEFDSSDSVAASFSLRQLLSHAKDRVMTTPLLRLTLHSKRDVVLARQSARQLAKLLGFDFPEQTRIAAIVFEIAFNACRSMGRATLHFQLTDSHFEVFPTGAGCSQRLPASDHSKRQGAPKSSPHWDPAGIRRLASHLRLHPANPGARLLRLDQPLGDAVPAVAREDLPWIAHQLTRLKPTDLFQEIRDQNQELLHALGQLAAREAASPRSANQRKIDAA
jgi:hypothetical protein